MSKHLKIFIGGKEVDALHLPCVPTEGWRDNLEKIGKRKSWKLNAGDLIPYDMPTTFFPIYFYYKRKNRYYFRGEKGRLSLDFTERIDFKKDTPYEFIINTV